MSVKLERVLVLDDDASVRESLTGFLQREGYHASPVATVAEAKAAIATQSFDLVLADLLLAGGNLSLNFLRELRQLRPKLPIIILTGHGSMDSAIEAIKIGIFDYLLKPINAEELRIALARLESIEQMRAENTYLRQEVAKGSSRTSPTWGTSEPMQEVLRLIEAAADTEACVLIQGPGGSGKSSVAQAIFEKSSRAGKPFVRVNCNLMPERNLEVEIFGEESNPAQAVTERRAGRLETADGGTLYFEEISKLSPALQLKLFHVLRDRVFQRVGSDKSIPIDVRIIVGTKQPLQELVSLGQFREDLYYLLNVLPIFLPPLRERGEDIFLIADSFLQQLMRKHGKKTTGLTAESRQKMSDYVWPGNVRELFNVLERGLVLAAPGAGLAPEDLALQGAPRDSLNFLNSGQLPTIDEMEKRLIGLMLKQTDNNKSRAAKKLGISIRTMRNKLLKYKADGIDVENPENLLKP